MSQQDLVERILELLHEAALDDAQWPAAARHINEASQAKSNCLQFCDRQRQTGPEPFFCRLVVGEQYRLDLQRAYSRDFFLHDESLPRIEELPPGQLTPTTELYTDQEKKTSRTYNLIRGDCRLKNGLSVYLDGPVGSQSIWTFGDSIAPGGWSSDQLAMVSWLLPHALQFVRVQRALADAEAVGSSLPDLLDNDRFGVIQLDQQGRVVEANNRASSLLRKGDGLFDRDGFLAARRMDEDAELQRLLARVLTPLAAQVAAGSMTIRRASRRARLVVHINPVAHRQWYPGAKRVAVLVLVVDPDRSARINPGLVAEALGLTPAEAHLAVMLATGHSVPAIAALTQRTEGTVRWHMKQIFRKQRVSRQADLVRRVLSLDGFPGSEC